VAKAAKYILVLAVGLAIVSAIAGIVAGRRYGPSAYEASAIAAVLNWVAGSMALVVMVACRQPAARAQRVLLAVAVRMALPLAALMYFFQVQHPLSAVGIGGLIVVHYLAGLVLETLLGIRLVASEACHRPPGPPLAATIDC
jgi:hypothetical protein